MTYKEAAQQGKFNRTQVEKNLISLRAELEYHENIHENISIPFQADFYASKNIRPINDNIDHNERALKALTEIGA